MNNQELFLEYVRAYNAKDVDRLLARFDDACVFESISAGKIAIRARGRSELEALARKSADAFASREQKVITLTGGEGRIVAEIEFRAVLHKDLTPELKAGSRLDLRGVSVCEIANGKIVRLADYA